MYRVLEILKENGGYVSGEAIAKELGISRTAVWKYIFKLRSEGYDISSSTKKGYLLNVGDVFNENEIKLENLVFEKELDSTNTRAKMLACTKAEHGTVVTCDRQTGGRGRLGRGWADTKGEGLAFSLVLKPDVMPEEASKLTLISGLAVAEEIERQTGAKAEIKWPNDIIINGKKVCGILTEISTEIMRLDYAVVGIGINVNNREFPKDIADKATSLYMESGKCFMRARLLEGCVRRILAYTKELEEKSLLPFKERLEDRSLMTGRHVIAVKYPTGEIICEGTAGGLTDGGELKIVCQDGTVKTVGAGEVSVRLDNGKYI